MAFGFTMTVDLATDAPTALRHATTFAGVNEELRPFLRMTVPRTADGMTILDAPLRTPLFRCWILLGGVLPIDYDYLGFERIDAETGFVESSTMLSMRSWRHERRVHATVPGRATLLDRITFVPRIPGSGRLLDAVTQRLFVHRRARLRDIFGAG